MTQRTFRDCSAILFLAVVPLLVLAPHSSVAQRPRPSSTYAGRDANASWRVAAAERIRKHRQAPFAVTIVDGNGDPVQGVDVQVKMKRHAFRFGSTISVPILMDETENGRRYREVVEKWFNHVSVENALKWKAWEGFYGRPEQRRKTIEALKWLEKKEIPVHGHVLVWPSWKHSPSGLRELAGDKAALASRVDRHLVDMVKRTRGLTYEWDVVNEAFSNRDLMKVLGEDVLAHWFELAHQTNPELRLYYNDYGILSSRGRVDSAHRSHYYNLAKSLLDAGAPLQGLGLQGHMKERLTPPEELLKLLDHYAALGLPIQITEFDLVTADEKLQADYWRDFMTVVFSHPAVNGFVMWGFWEGRHWRPQAALFRRDWTIKPNGQEYERLVFHEWWTDITEQTDDQGMVVSRGFKGDYEVTIRRGNTVIRKPLEIGDDGGKLTIRLSNGHKQHKEPRKD